MPGAQVWVLGGEEGVPLHPRRSSVGDPKMRDSRFLPHGTIHVGLPLLRTLKVGVGTPEACCRKGSKLRGLRVREGPMLANVRSSQQGMGMPGPSQGAR